jgi:hypothetical protein
MTEIACLIADMIRAGVDPDLVGRTAEAFAAGPQRTARQERNARYYAKTAAAKRLTASEQDASDGSDVSDASEGIASPEGSSPAPLSPLPAPSPSEGSGSPRENLMAVLDDAHASAVLAHRARLGKPLSAHATRLLARSLAAFADPNGAAERMMERGWPNIDAGWQAVRTTGVVAGAAAGARHETG